ncbi:MAG: type II CAAX endopeptidase family protein [Methanobacterium sp.]
MSNIRFLDNAVNGKNNWFSYLLTIGITVIGGILASIALIVLFMLVYFLSMKTTPVNILFNILNNAMIILILVGISYGIITLLFYLCIKFIHKKQFISLINIGKNINMNRIFKGAGLWAGIMTLFTLVSIIYSKGSLSFHFDPVLFLYLLIISLLVFPLQASFEEIFFRGYLMQAFGLLSKKPVVPLIITTLIFGLIHFYNGTNLEMSITIVLSALILGLMLGIIVLGENGLETAMGAHIANNMFVALFLNSSDSGLGNLPSLITSSSYNPYSEILLLMGMAVFMITILFWNKKENLYRIFQ